MFFGTGYAGGLFFLGIFVVLSCVVIVHNLLHALRKSRTCICSVPEYYHVKFLYSVSVRCWYFDIAVLRKCLHILECAEDLYKFRTCVVGLTSSPG